MDDKFPVDKKTMGVISQEQMEALRKKNDGNDPYINASFKGDEVNLTFVLNMKNDKRSDPDTLGQTIAMLIDHALKSYVSAGFPEKVIMPRMMGSVLEKIREINHRVYGIT